MKRRRKSQQCTQQLNRLSIANTCSMETGDEESYIHFFVNSYGFIKYVYNGKRDNKDQYGIVQYCTPGLQLLFQLPVEFD